MLTSKSHPVINPFLMFLTAVLCLVIIGLAFTGFAQASNRGEGSRMISGYIVDILDNKLLGSDPTRIESIALNVVSQSGTISPSKVLVSVDEGDNWIECNYQGGAFWKCSFLQNDEPLIAALDIIRVVASE